MNKMFIRLVSALTVLAMLLTGAACLAEAAEPAQLYFTPGEDLLLGEAEGVKVWLEGAQDSDAHAVRVENQGDRSVYLGMRVAAGDRDTGFRIYGTAIGPDASETFSFDLPRDDRGRAFGGSPSASVFVTICGDTGGEEKLADFGEIIVRYDGGQPASDAATQAFTLDDFLGEWRLYIVALVENGEVGTTAFVDDLGDAAPKMTFAITPDQVTLASGSEDPLVMDSVEIKTDENSGENYLAASDGGEGYVDLSMTTIDGENYIHLYTNGTLLYFKRTDAPATPDDGSTETGETPDPGRVYTDRDTVQKVQQALNDAGYSCGTPDGVAGKKTVAAITQYQTDKGLTATGTVTDELLSALGL